MFRRRIRTNQDFALWVRNRAIDAEVNAAITRMGLTPPDDVTTPAQRREWLAAQIEARPANDPAPYDPRARANDVDYTRVLATVLGCLILLCGVIVFVAWIASDPFGDENDTEHANGGDSDSGTPLHQPTSGNPGANPTPQGGSGSGGSAQTSCKPIDAQSGSAVQPGWGVPAGGCVLVEVTSESNKALWIGVGPFPVEITAGSVPSSPDVHINAWVFKSQAEAVAALPGQVRERQNQGWKVTQVSAADLQQKFSTSGGGSAGGNVDNRNGGGSGGSQGGSGSNVVPLKPIPPQESLPLTQPSSAGNVQRVHLGQNIWKGVQIDLTGAKAGANEYLVLQGDVDETGTCKVWAFHGPINGLDRLSLGIGSATFHLYLVRGGTEETRKQEVKIMAFIASRESPCDPTFR